MNKGKIVFLGIVTTLFSLTFITHIIAHLLIYIPFFISKIDKIPLYFYNLDLNSLRISFASFGSYSFYALITETIILFILISLLVDAIRTNRTHKEVLILKELHKGRSTTDLDNLYEILKNKKTLSFPMISKAFKVSEDVVFEWGKILEEGNLAKITYPRMSDPQIIITENKENEENE